MARGRPATGSVIFLEGQWHVRVTMPDGSRPPIAMPGIAQDDVAEAKRMGAIVSRRARELSAVPFEKGETVNEWADRWLDEREARGLTSIRSDRSRVRQHVLPDLGPLAMREVTRDDLERFVERLDRRVSEGAIGWKTAGLIWGLVTKMFDDATNAKRRDLRVREDNPAYRVRGPDAGATKAKQYLYPSELLALVSCKRVPQRRRELYAVAVYLYARAGELDALTWSDVDLEHGVVHVTKAIHRDTGEVKATKTKETRRVAIEPALLPLLERLKREATGKKAFTMPLGQDQAILLRADLKEAGVERPSLYADNETSKHITFHDLRSTGITWRAVRGDDPLKIQQGAGHADFKTTSGYIREAQVFEEGFGAVFPPLPKELLTPEPGISAGLSDSGFVLAGLSRPLLRRAWDSKPPQNTDDSAENKANGDDRPDLSGSEESPSVVQDPEPSIDPVEAALVEALKAATLAGRFDVVAQLAKELEVRRVARTAANVVPFPERRAK